MSHIVLHIVFLKFAHNYYFYADALSLTSSRSATKFATMKLSLIKCQRASMVCFRISSYAQTYIHFIRKTKLLIHTSTLAILRQEHFSYISSVLELFSLFLYCSLSFFAYFPKLEQFFLSAYFTPIPALSNLSGLEHLLQIHPLCSNFSTKQHFQFGVTSPNPPALLQLQAYALFSSWSIFSKSTGFAPIPHAAAYCPKAKAPWQMPRGFVYSLKTDISSVPYLSLLQHA